MKRVRRLSKEEVSDETRALYERIGKQRGNVPNLFRIYAHRPPILKVMMEHLNTSTMQGEVTPRLKELIATLVSRVNHCHY